MKQWNEYWFDGRMCVSAKQETPEAPVIMGWAIQHANDEGKGNRKRARLIATGRRESDRSFYLGKEASANLKEAFTAELQDLFSGYMTVFPKGNARRFCDKHRLAAWILPLLGVE
jgi:hypothetical protein